MGRARILVIDDDELIADSFRLVLAAEGYDVESVGSASGVNSESSLVTSR